MRATTGIRLAYAGLAALDSVLAGLPGERARRARRVTKPLLVPTLLALDRAVPGDSALRRSTRVALGCGWAGDVALLGAGEAAFSAGAACFGAGHVVTVRGLRAAGATGVLRRPGTRAVGLAWLATGPRVATGASRRSPALGVAVAAYSLVLPTMVAHALARHGDGARLGAAGAATFLLSDAVLGWTTFVSENADARWEWLVMGSYATAQLLLTEGATRG